MVFAVGRADCLIGCALVAQLRLLRRGERATYILGLRQDSRA